MIAFALDLYDKDYYQMYHYTEADFNTESSANSSIVTDGDKQTTAQEERNAYIEAQASDLAPEIEIDSVEDSDFGLLYRVWYTSKLIGNFYRANDGQWVVMPCDSDNRPRCNTAAEAQLLIVAIAGLLVADTAHEESDVEQLLNKPFDELTPDEWEYLKQHAQAAELLAA